jgi:arylamine N-acetyltransferase
MSPFLTAYFARIGWKQPASADIDTLRALHLHHNCAIPFENIDVVLPREIHLEDQCLVDKLLTARRGDTALSKTACLSGYCVTSGLPCAAYWGAWY